MNISFTLSEIKMLDGLIKGQIKLNRESRDLYGTALPHYPEWEQKLNNDIDIFRSIKRKLNQ
jgi:hypothetical protein